MLTYVSTVYIFFRWLLKQSGWTHCFPWKSTKTMKTARKKIDVLFAELLCIDERKQSNVYVWQEQAFRCHREPFWFIRLVSVNGIPILIKCSINKVSFLIRLRIYLADAGHFLDVYILVVNFEEKMDVNYYVPNIVFSFWFISKYHASICQIFRLFLSIQMARMYSRRNSLINVSLQIIRLIFLEYASNFL